MIRKLLAHPTFFRALLAFLIFAVLAAGFLTWKSDVDKAALLRWWKDLETFLKANPVWLFAALVVLPGLPIPTSALLLIAGSVWGEHPIAACGISILALLLNMTWTYWLAAGPARGLMEKILASGEIRLPPLRRTNQVGMILVLRLTPGLPLFLQNYLLGFFRVNFWLYLGLSFLCSGIIACGFVLAGAGISDGNAMPLIAGLSLIMVGFVVVRMIRAKLRKPLHEQPE
ncbi:MAG: VTT domain-containing protein [Verrucomicrobiota bacterium]